MRPLAIRPLDASHPPVIAAAFVGSGWPRPREQYERYVAQQKAGRRQVWVAFAGEAFAGYVALDWQPSYRPFAAEGIPEIHDLNVLPGFRRRGIGSALLDAAEGAAGARVRAVGIGVGLDPDHGPAQRLYVLRGYVPDGRGICWRDSTVSYGEQVIVDDDLLLYLTPYTARRRRMIDSRVGPLDLDAAVAGYLRYNESLRHGHPDAVLDPDESDEAAWDAVETAIRHAPAADGDE